MDDKTNTLNEIDSALPTAVPSQAELYDDLRRIGELEDQKRELQGEIDAKTARLRAATDHLDKGSLLYKMLASALQPQEKVATPRKSMTKSTRTKSTSTKKQSKRAGG
jgi:hypothetical protein